jgi:hypothetical protein
MTYSVTYYRDITMQTPLADMDRDLPDSAIEAGRYPAPAVNEGVAVARRHDGETRYGYAGLWHSTIPAPAAAFTRKQAAEMRAAALGLLPKTGTGETWELIGAGPDRVILNHLRSDHVSDQPWRKPEGRIELSWDDLAAAAEGSAWYAEVLRRARQAVYKPGC